MMDNSNSTEPRYDAALEGFDPTRTGDWQLPQETSRALQRQMIWAPLPQSLYHPPIQSVYPEYNNIDLNPPDDTLQSVLHDHQIDHPNPRGDALQPVRDQNIDLNQLDDPLRCKQCQRTFGTRFSVNRHHREVHERSKPILCKVENCVRAKLGNGFARHWNMTDHMRRRHGRDSAPGE